MPSDYNKPNNQINCMNEIIIKRGYTYHIEPKRQSGDRVALSGRGQVRRIQRKIKMDEQPNLDLNMLRNGRLSQKKSHPRTGHHSSLSRQQQLPRKQSSSLLGEMQNNNARIEKKIDEMITNTHQHELYFKKSYTNLKQRRVYFNHKHKIKQPSPEVIGKINSTAPLRDQPTIRSQPLKNKQEKAPNLLKSQSCKGRPSSNLMNPEELFQAYKNHQVYELNKRVVLRMNREKDKQFYEQAIAHLFQLAKHSFFHNKVRSEMPSELDVNKIVIPRRNYREEWADKVKKYQQNAIKYRQESQKKAAVESIINDRKGPVKIRAKTDAKFSHKSNRNQTQFLQKHDIWNDLIEKPFEPWQFEVANSKFFE